MRIQNLLLTTVMCTVSFVAHAADIKATSKLTAATVYTNRAMLTQTAVVELPAGAHNVVLNDLGADLMPDSLRAEGTALAPVKFGALSSKFVPGSNLSVPRERELNDQILALQDTRRGVEAEKNALSAKQKFLETVAAQGAARSQEKIAEVNLKPGEWSGAADAIFSGMSAVLKSQVAADIKLRDIDAQISKLQTELSQAQTGFKNTYQVMIPVEVSAATTLTINLSYQSPNASWTPLYDARLNTKTGKVELTQYGSVRQNTGVDWQDVRLTLSTAQPTRGAGLPDLSLMWVNLTRYEELAAPASMAMSFNAMDSAQLAGAAAPMREERAMLKAAEPVAAQFVAATIDTGGFVGEYKIPGPANVKSDGTDSKLMIGNFDTDSKMQVKVKPQLSTDAFLVAHATLKGEAPILPGPVNLFRDGAYVGQMSLPLLRPGEARDLAFGIDDQVAVKRKVIKDERSEAGMITRETQLERQYLTEVQNLHNIPIEVVVDETTPVAGDKQIRADIVIDATTPGYVKDADKITGLLRWVVQMAPKQKSDVKLGWKIAWPKDQQLNGI